VIRALIWRTIVMAIAFLVVDWLMDSVQIEGGVPGAIGLAVLFGLVSAVIGTLLRLLALPLLILTLGLFEIVINAGLLLFTSWLTDWLSIDNFGAALIAAILLAVTSAVVGFALGMVAPSSKS